MNIFAKLEIIGFGAVVGGAAIAAFEIGGVLAGLAALLVFGGSSTVYLSNAYDIEEEEPTE